MKTWLLLSLLFSNPEQVRWVSEHAVTVRSIDPADEDFSDLMPLVQVIGKARVVQLGEATHGDGATFLAKGRLIRFLHQVMGFDVLAWEAGFFDVERVDAALRAGLPATEVANRGLYGIWKVKEVAPTLDYVRESQGTERPILTVGFDCRVSTPANRAEHFPKRVFAFELPKRLVEIIDRRRADFLVHYSAREIDWVRQSLVSLMAMDRALGPGDQQPTGYNRDAAMAENLLWWLNGPLADRKVVVWAHNYHVMHDLYGREAKVAVPGGPMGRFLKDELGSDLYTIGFDSFGGTHLGEEDKPAPVTPGELETLLHGVGRPLLFLDLSRLPGDHWLRARMTGSFYFHEPHAADWTRIFDGIFFIDSQKPSTPW